MNEMENIERHMNDLAVSEEHPYFRGEPEDRDRVLGIVEGCLKLVEALYLVPRGKIEKVGRRRI